MCAFRLAILLPPLLVSNKGENQKAFWKPASLDYAAACEGADAIVVGGFCLSQGWCLAEKHKAK